MRKERGCSAKGSYRNCAVSEVVLKGHVLRGWKRMERQRRPKVLGDRRQHGDIWRGAAPWPYVPVRRMAKSVSEALLSSFLL